MRTQPWLALWPMLEYSDGSIPWMPAPPLNAIQRDLIGSSGPGGIVLPARSPAHAEFGTCQDGFVSRHWTSYSPAGVSRPCRPTAIGYVRSSLRLRYSRSVKFLRSTMM